MSDIPVVILCGGQGTRMGDTLAKKELVAIGERPLLWHVMRIFSAYGHNDFVLTLGHLGDQIRRYFLEYQTMARDVTLRIPGASGVATPTPHGSLDHPEWSVTLADTGLQAEKAARLRHVAHYLKADRFFVAYGEAVADIDLDALLAFHKKHGKLATVTGVQVPYHYGLIEADEAGLVGALVEKPILPHWINGGFMLLETAVLDRIPDREDADLEREILPQLAAEEQLMLFRHWGYWQSMKTLKDARTLNEDWERDQPWQVWS